MTRFEPVERVSWLHSKWRRRTSLQALEQDDRYPETIARCCSATVLRQERRFRAQQSLRQPKPSCLRREMARRLIPCVTASAICDMCVLFRTSLIPIHCLYRSARAVIPSTTRHGPLLTTTRCDRHQPATDMDRLLTPVLFCLDKYPLRCVSRSSRCILRMKFLNRISFSTG
jgi:hypothetical protein